MITQMEAGLNSRPLTSLPYPEDGSEVLTPGHFLNGRPIEALADPIHDTPLIALVQRWQLGQKLTNDLWQRWSNKYLAQLQRIVKWTTPNKSLNVGDVVCVKSPTMGPTKWLLGRVMQEHRGEDGLVRVATIHTSQGIYKRPVTKLVPLPTYDENL